MDLITIAGYLYTFTDGILLLVPEHRMPFAKEPKKVLHDEEAELYIGSPLYATTVEIRVDTDSSVDLLQGLDRKLVTIRGRVETRPSRGIEQPGVIAERVARHGDIADLAYASHLRGDGGSAEEQWLRAEDALLAEPASPSEVAGS
jgi:hypothetical protein